MEHRTTTERRQLIAAALEAVREVIAEPFRATDDELSHLLGELAQLGSACTAGLVALTADADSRGMIERSQCAKPAAWVADQAWHARRNAYQIAKAAQLIRRRDLAPLAESVLTTDLDPSTAVVVAAQYDALAPELKPEARPVVLDSMLAVGAEHGPKAVRDLKTLLLIRYGEEDAFEDQQATCRRQISLSAGVETAKGVWELRLAMDNDSRAVLEAAIGPGAAPRPDTATGAPDTRPVDRRRGEALIEALRRSVTAAQHVPTAPKATLVVTMAWEQLRDQLGAGEATGTLASGTALTPATVRRIACDAGILPAVLGTRGEVVDLGERARLFSRKQVQGLWVRDRHCTFDGCDAPSAWCDAHHLVHWADGGPTNLSNAALLCGRHHQIVHRDRLHGELHDGRVVWDRRPNSYRPPPRPPKPRCNSPRLPQQRGVVVRR